MISWWCDDGCEKAEVVKPNIIYFIWKILALTPIFKGTKLFIFITKNVNLYEFLNLKNVNIQKIAS